MSKQMIIRIDAELKERMQRLAKAEGKNASQVLRELVEDYVAQRDPAGAIEDLWERIGGRLRERGVRTKEIRKAIRDVRAAR